MVRGLDADVDLTVHAGLIKSAGYDWVGRYYKFTHDSHGLTRAEASALSAAGLYLVAIYENGSPTQASYFSRLRGAADGLRAYHYAAQEIRQPAGYPIYFAVDYDAPEADVLGPIHEYFTQIHTAFEQAGLGHPVYPIGVYGSGAVCRYLLRETVVSYAWLAGSMGWRGSRQYRGWNLRQQAPPVTVAGVAVDRDESRGFGGGFRV